MHTPMTCLLVDDAQTLDDLTSAIYSATYKSGDVQKIGQILKDDPSLATKTGSVSSHPNPPATSLHHRTTILI